ncbi:MAG: hypothetical protein EOO78_17095, partial [Oxalobacteraceae bacterium]
MRRLLPPRSGMVLPPYPQRPCELGRTPRLRDYLQHSLGELPGAEVRARRWLPGALAQWFPRADAAGAPAYYSVRALQFALQWLLGRNEGPHQAPALRPVLRRFCDTLDHTAQSLIDTMCAGEAARAGLIAAPEYAATCAATLAPLRQGRPALLQAGYIGARYAHTISLYFVPQADDRVLWAVIDRADDASAFHPVDATGRAQPLVYQTTRAALQ